jgi:two-component system sensor histidine kinase CpxA
VKSLSLRIFLVFWAALIAIVAAAIGVTILFLTHREELPRTRAVVLDEAVAALAEGDRSGLEAWLRRRQLGSGPRVYAFDESGRELLDRPVERPLERPLERLGRLRPPAHGLADVRVRPPEPYPTLIAPDGSEYRLLVVPRRPGAFGALGFSEVRVPVLLFALAITAVLSWLLARSITRPIDDLTRATQAFANGRLDALPAPNTLARRDELGRLAASFGEMGGRIRALLASRERLLQDISHELRSPLARIRLALGLAAQPGADVAAQFGRLERDVERLDALIGEVLSVTRLEAKIATLERVDTDLVALVGDIARDAGFEAEAAGKSVRQVTEATAAVAAVDPTWMASAIENVVRNAVRHTAVGSEVLITLNSSPGGLAIRVRDHGPGVPPADLTKIFEPFYRVTTARERDSGGEGLGLAITARVMAAHGGRVEARNPDGGGLEVELWLPPPAALRS